MLSNRPFSQFAKAAGPRNTRGLSHLKTISELHEEILHIRSYLHESLRRYEDAKRFDDYIPLRARSSSTPEDEGRIQSS